MSGDYYTCVQRILNHVNPGILQKFNHLDVDIKRVVYVRQLDFVDAAFQIEPHREEKSSVEAKKWREKGNVCYQKHDYPGALECYTKSTIHAPATYRQGVMDEELSLALANRSAALFQLVRYDHALQDMELALRHGYPEILRYKLYDRKGKCMMQLNKHEEAITAFGKAEEYLKVAKLDNTKKKNWTDNMAKFVETCTSLKGSSKEAKTVEFVDSDGSECSNSNGCFMVDGIPRPRMPLSSRFPVASDAFNVRYEEDSGRFAIARRPVKVGDVIISEPPYVSVLRQDFYTTHCYNCFTKLVNPIGCYTCVSARFCSATCRDYSWKAYHSIECKYVRMIDLSGIGLMGHLALRMILVSGLGKLLSRRSGSRNNHRVLIDEDGVYIGGYESLLDLVGNSSHRHSNEMFQYTILTIFLIKVLKDGGFFQGDVMRQRKAVVVENYVGGILLRFLQIITCNGVEIMETYFEENIQKAEQSSMGLALYPTVSVINHSCNPNTELIFYGNTCIVRSIRMVPGGTELNIDYGYIYYLTERKQRQFSLRSQYYFECICEACRNHWPLKSSLPSGIPTLKCRKCGAPMPLNSDNASDPTLVKCRKCGLAQKPLTYLEEFYESSRLFDKCINEIRMGKVEGPARILENHITVMEKCVMLPTKDYITCLSALKQCYRVMGNSVRRRQQNQMGIQPHFEYT